jgi:cell division protein FtsB
MGMVKDSEVFVQFVSPNASSSVPATLVPSTTSTRGEVSAAPVSVVPNPVSREKPKRAEKKHQAEKAKHAGEQKRHGAG